MAAPWVLGLVGALGGGMSAAGEIGQQRAVRAQRQQQLDLEQQREQDQQARFAQQDAQTKQQRAFENATHLLALRDQFGLVPQDQTTADVPKMAAAGDIGPMPGDPSSAVFPAALAAKAAALRSAPAITLPDPSGAGGSLSFVSDPTRTREARTEAQALRLKQMDEDRVTAQQNLIEARQRAEKDAANRRKFAAGLSIGLLPKGSSYDPNVDYDELVGMQERAQARADSREAVNAQKEIAREQTRAQQAYQRTQGLTQDFQRNPTVKSAYDLASRVQGLQAGLSGQSPMDDLALIYETVKLFDPQSAVREGEIKLARSANSLPGQIGLMVDHWNSGRILTPEMRQQIGQLLQRKVQESQAAIAPVQSDFGAQARRAGVAADSAFIAPSPFQGVNLPAKVDVNAERALAAQHLATAKTPAERAVIKQTFRQRTGVDYDAR